MNWLLRHNFWMVKLLGLVVTMALLANTTTTLIALYLLADRQPVERAAVLAAADDDEDDPEARYGSPESYRKLFYEQRARDAERRAERILGPNVFCPTCSPATEGGAEAGPAESAPDPTGTTRRSQLPLVVAATMEHTDPSLSVATIVDTQRGVGGLYGVGDVIGGQVEIVHVDTGVVHINNNGVLEYIPFGMLPAAPAPSPAPKAEPKPSPRASSRAIEGAEEAIQCTEKGDCVVDRAFVEKLIADPKLLMGQGRMSPATTKDGSPGFRVRGAGKGTLPQLLGLENGDVITEISGSPLTMEAAMSLYGKLRHASHVEVTVDRRGQRMRRQLDIRS